MTTAAAQMISDDSAHAKAAARTLRGLLDGGGEAEAVEIDGDWYVVTTGTGDGSFAYEVEAVEDGCAAWRKADSRLEQVGRDHGVNSDEYTEAQRTGGYASFCDAATPTEDERVAVALYLRGTTIDAPGACTPILSEEARRVLDIVKDMVG